MDYNSNNQMSKFGNENSLFQTILDCLKANVILVMALLLCSTLCLLLSANYNAFLWGYLIICNVVSCAYVFCNKVTKNSQSSNNGVKTADLNVKITGLENRMKELLLQIENQGLDIKNKDNRIVELGSLLSATEKELSLGNRYMDVLVLFQHLDTWVDALPEEVSDFKILTREQISQVLAKYGYKFLDFSFEDMKSYDYEICPNDPQEIAYRAIANKSGTVAKGKVYLPKI